MKQIGEAATNVLNGLEQRLQARSTRHRWGERTARDPNNTTRICLRCGIVRITRHEPDNFPPHWVEFECDGMKIDTVKVPKCEVAA